MKPRPAILLVLTGVVALPQQAYANAGTPLMWAGMLHLAFGNALIGFLEGYLLAWLFRIPRAKAVGIMIAANYVSAWVGGLFIRGAMVKALPMDLNNGWFWFWVMVATTFAVTLLIEWPFVALSLRGVRHWLVRSVRASLLIQGSSYALLFAWYWMASGTSLYTQMRIVPPADLHLPASVAVYFISPADGDVYRRDFRGSVGQKVFELDSQDKNDRLFVRPNAAETGRWDLVARLETADRQNPRYVAVMTNLPLEAVPDQGSTFGDPPDNKGTWFNFGSVQALGGATNSQWKFWAGFWPAEGLRASRKGTGEQLRFSYETPFGAWNVRNAVHLPNDKVLFQFGNNQICGFDPAERRVALLWHGRGPVAVMEKEKSNQTTQPTDPPVGQRDIQSPLG